MIAGIQVDRDAEVLAEECVQHWRVVVVEDEEFTRSLLTQTLTSVGIEVRSAPSASEGMALIDQFNPHVVMTDLDLGVGPSGIHLLNKVHAQAPWIGKVVLTAHASPSLATTDPSALPDEVVYVVKADVTSAEQLFEAIRSSLTNEGHHVVRDAEDRIVLSAAHGETLRLMGMGLSNAGIAEARGTTLRAAEGMVQRVFLALGLKSDAHYNMRVLAVKMLQQGRIVIR